MADFFMDTDAGSDANNGTTWALAKLTTEGLLAVMSAGDNGWIQGAAADDSVSDRTLASPGASSNPCIVTGVVDGTTNEPPLVSDLAVTLPVISTTGSAPDINFTGSISYRNIHISIGDRGTTANDQLFEILNGKFSISDRFTNGTGTVIRFENTVHEPLVTTGVMTVPTNSLLEMLGGSYLATTNTPIIRSLSGGVIKFSGYDLSALNTALSEVSTSSRHKMIIANCKVPAVFTLFESAILNISNDATVIASSDTTSQAASSSVQDYRYEGFYGTIDSELTAVRTGGADDGASGAFSYAMTPNANATLESSSATLKSPWMRVWVEGGSNTLTVYVANDSASTDYNEDELWCEFYTPDAGDTAQHDQTFDPANARLFASSTAVTDDTGSTWGTGANNHQKMSVTVTTGFEGEAYVRLHLAKRSATPDTLFLDPKIEIS